VYKKFDAPRDRPARGGGFGGDARKSGGDFAPRKFAGKPGGKPGGFSGKSSGKPGGFGGKKKSGGFGKKSDKPFTGKPTNTFAKFAGNKKPFGKRPPGRKFKPSQGESA
jgi:23S rRNA pseudouridine2605 synthase